MELIKLSLIAKSEKEAYTIFFSILQLYLKEIYNLNKLQLYKLKSIRIKGNLSLRRSGTMRSQDLFLNEKHV